MSTANEKPNCEIITLEAIKENIHSIILDKDKNIVEFVLKHCKLLGIDYDEQSVKLKLDLEATDNQKKQPHSPEAVDEDNMQTKLALLKKSNNEKMERKMKEDDTKTKNTNTSNKKHTNKKQTNGPKNNKTKSKTIKKKRNSKKKLINNSNKKGLYTLEESKESKDDKDAKLSKSIKPVINTETHKSKKRKGKKHLRQRSKTTDDIATYSIQAHNKWSYYSTELTAKQLIRCQGFADIKSRYKFVQELKFGSKLRREDVMEFKVPINTQVIRAYVVEDCLADGTNGEIVKCHGGIGKKFVRLFIKSQMDKGVHMKLHAWYK